MDHKERPEEVSEALCDHLERYSLPPVEPLVTPSAHEASEYYLPGYSEIDSPVFMVTKIMGACFDGDFDQAQRLADACLDQGILPSQLDGPHIRTIVEMQHLLRTNRALIPSLMHEWEEAKVDALKLKKYWRPTPFPCDVAEGK